MHTPRGFETSDLWFRRLISTFPALFFQPFRLATFARLDAVLGCCPLSAPPALPTKIRPNHLVFEKRTKVRKMALLRSATVSARKKRTRPKKARRSIIIAGPNGAGKTTFAQGFRHLR